MRFRVLGPVEVEARGRLLDIGPPQRRMVLAALAVDAGSPVPIETIARRVWTSAAPDASRSAIYAHVARLRRVLGRAGAAGAAGEAGKAGDAAVSLSRHSAGYVLDIDPQMVDLHRFLALIQSSRVTGDVDRTVMLREALDLWRGPPLSASSGDWAVRLRTSVESQFIGATMAWAEEELRQAHPEVVADRLARVVAGYPLAEPVVALLMRALCALGRTAEALQRYADTRSRLADQLGAEPGTELSVLHVAILRGEINGTPVASANGATPNGATANGALATGAGTAGGAVPPGRTPRQLPADLSRFTGRPRELAHIDRWLTGTQRQGAPAVLAIHGPAGVGKSALAVHAAHRLAGHYPDGQLYLDLRGSAAEPVPLATAEGLARLLRALGAAAPNAPENLDEAAALFRSMVAGRRLLILLDNATTAAHVRLLLPSDAGCATLVTSRRALLGLGDVGQLRLGPLGTEQAVELLGQWAGAARVAAEPDAAAAIVRRCERLPIALCAAGARLAARPGWPLAELARRLADPARRLDNLEFDGVGVRASLAACLRQLELSDDRVDRAAVEAFTLLGTAFETRFDGRAAAALLARSPEVTERLLDRLVDAELLEDSSPDGYWVPDLLRGYARERAALPAPCS